MIAGVDLYPSDDVAAVLRGILEESPPASLELLCGDERMAAVIHRALSRDPAERFPSILAFADALERVATGGSAGAAGRRTAAAPSSPLGAGSCTRRPASR